MARTRKRRTVDTWKSKSWYNILTPKVFGEVEVGKTIASEPSALTGRIINTTMREITGDFSKQHIKIKLKIADVKGNNCYTVFKGQSLSRDYMRSQIRRKSTRVEGTVDVKTRDGHLLRVKAIALAIGRAQTAQEKLIRKILIDMVKEAAEKMELDEFVQETISGKLSASIYRAGGKIYPLKRVEVRKIKVPEKSEESVPIKSEEPSEKTETPAA